jgi:DNA primase
VASSGTSLTEGQIRLISRFTNNVTVIYDSDAAGVKASLRGIDMLLAAGLNIKVLSLPDGDDPDSYAQNHSAAELEDYLATHEVDFIRFKTNILLQDSGDDPIKRSQVINDILRSVSVIENEVVRTVYIAECSRMLEVPETVLARQVATLIAKRREDDGKAMQRKHAEDSISDIVKSEADKVGPLNNSVGSNISTSSAQQSLDLKSNPLEPYEREIIRYVLKYGMLPFCDAVDENNQPISISLVDYVSNELSNDDIKNNGQRSTKQRLRSVNKIGRKCLKTVRKKSGLKHMIWQI